MSRVAAVDCGTNSIRLLVADVGGSQPPREVLRRTEIVRLGEGVDRTGLLSTAALDRVRARCAEFGQACADLGVERLVFAATSASRDAQNAGDLETIVRTAFARWGTRPVVLTGAQEGKLTYLGAARAVAGIGIEGSIVVVDIGGGSTEIVRGTGTHVEAAVSLDVGAVRLLERLAPSDPPSRDDRARLEEVVGEALDAGLAEVPLVGAATVVGVAGTSTTVAAHELRLDRYDAARVHLARSAPWSAAAAARGLAAMTTASRGALPYVVPGREDVLATGALLWALVLDRAATAGIPQVVVSEHDLLDGLCALA